jgi:protein involved in polysaccharide export with SLBB domain
MRIRRTVLTVVTALLLVAGLTAQEKQRFFVTGRVKHPGAYAYREGLTAATATC